MGGGGGIGGIHIGIGATTIGTTSGGGGGKRGDGTQHGQRGTTAGLHTGNCGPQYDPGTPNA
ncbi:MAG: hypothetical protein WCG29_08010 [Desulfomonile sp.]|jgi:hypothetical protein